MKHDEIKIALVTGGNRGIGLAIVKALAEQGHRVLLGCRDLPAGTELANQITGDVTAVKMDLSTHASRQEDMQNLSNTHPKIDILINNAGTFDGSPFGGLTHEHLVNSLEVNALSAFELINHFAPKMQKNGYGRIVNIASSMGAFSEGLNGPSAYSMSKALLNAVTVTAAQYYTAGDMAINSMCPGWVQTDMGGKDATRTPEEGAQTALWLANLENSPTGGFYRDQELINW